MKILFFKALSELGRKGKANLLIIFILLVLSGMLTYANILPENLDIIKYVPGIILLVWLVIIRFKIFLQNHYR